MQIQDSFIEAALSLPNKREGNVLIGAMARYLAGGEEPKHLGAVTKAVWKAILPELRKSRDRISAGRSGGRSEVSVHRGGREPISARVRFEIFERDGFTCQYCGAKAPDVELHVDHIVPVSKGGTNDPGNLVTACARCNLGKSDLDTTRFNGESDG